MHVYILFAHPGAASFNRDVLDAFTRGLRDAGHSYEIADLYGMDFTSEMDVVGYDREVGLDPDAPLPKDVKLEHLEETGIAEAMRRIMLNDRLLGVGVKEARMEILGGMMPKDDAYRGANLARAYEIGRSF